MLRTARMAAATTWPTRAPVVLGTGRKGRRARSVGQPGVEDGLVIREQVDQCVVRGLGRRRRDRGVAGRIDLDHVRVVGPVDGVDRVEDGGLHDGQGAGGAVRPACLALAPR